MAQLIKLYDYISRYESNPFHYPTQYIQLKRENWRKLNDLWEKGSIVSQPESELNEEKNNKFRFNPFSKKNKVKEEVEEQQESNLQLPKTKKELTYYFLNKLFPFQLKWATSTISQVSVTDKNVQNDSYLNFFLQSVPDIYLMMYYPIFSVKNVPIEGEIILISPIGIEIIVLIEKNPNAVIVLNDDRTWLVEEENHTTKIISPLISLKRTEQIVKSILNKYGIQFSIHKTVMSKTNNFLFATEQYQVNIVGSREFTKWHDEKRNLSSPLKSDQLKTMDALLKHCQTTAVRRPEWEEDTQINELL